MRVSFTADAKNDLRDIGDLIGADSPQRAKSFTRELVAIAGKIGEAPRAYPLVTNYEASELRRRVAGSYLIFFRIVGGSVSVLRILHGARDYERIFAQRRP